MDTMNNGRIGSSASTSEGHGISPSATLHGNHPPDISHDVAQETSTPASPNDKVGGEDAGVLVVDWDGPDDLQNPKK